MNLFFRFSNIWGQFSVILSQTLCQVVSGPFLGNCRDRIMGGCSLSFQGPWNRPNCPKPQLCFELIQYITNKKDPSLKNHMTTPWKPPTKTTTSFALTFFPCFYYTCRSISYSFQTFGLCFHSMWSIIQWSSGIFSSRCQREAS